MLVRVATDRDVEDWVGLRTALWPHHTAEEHRAEIGALLARNSNRELALVSIEEAIGTLGFAEAALRHDYVNGCETSPVVFLEGIYVRPDSRRTGIARALCLVAEAWGRTQGRSEFASDALIENHASHAFHQAVGFEETERVVYFRKRL